MYRKEKRIPTLLALVLLLFGIGTVVYLDKNFTSLTSSANPSVLPVDIHFTNIGESSFTVSWLTAAPTTGVVEILAASNKTILLDDLDSDNIPRPRATHYFTVKNLRENTSYQVRIISGGSRCNTDESCPTLTQKTATRLAPTLSLPPTRGAIEKSDGKPADGAVVYLLIGKSLPLSSRADSSGLWVIPLNNIRSSDLFGRPEISDNDLVQITAWVSPNQSTTGVIDVKSIKENLTIPTMRIGNSYNFVDLITKKDILAVSTNQNILGTKTQNTTLPKIDVYFPKLDGDTTTDNRPKLRGIGPPGSQLLIIVNSSPQTGKVTVGQDGSWNWRPPNELPPGIHHLSIQGYDESGNLVTVNRKFIVLKSGEAVLGESTPSASLTPTATPSATLSPTKSPLSPTPTSTVSATLTPTKTITPTITTSSPTISPPRSGTSQPTLILLGGSLVFLLLGVKLLIFP